MISKLGLIVAVDERGTIHILDREEITDKNIGMSDYLDECRDMDDFEVNDLNNFTPGVYNAHFVVSGGGGWDISGEWIDPDIDINLGDPIWLIE